MYIGGLIFSLSLLKMDVTFKIITLYACMCDRSLLNFDLMMILKTSHINFGRTQ
jgi:hypothetical protein